MNRRQRHGQGYEWRPTWVGRRICKRSRELVFGFLESIPFAKKLPGVNQVRQRRGERRLALHGRLEGLQRSLFIAGPSVCQAEVVPDLPAPYAEGDGTFEMLARFRRSIVTQTCRTEADTYIGIVGREHGTFSQYLTCEVRRPRRFERVAEHVHQIHVARVLPQPVAGDFLRAHKILPLQRDERHHLHRVQRCRRELDAVPARSKRVVQPLLRRQRKRQTG